MMNETGKIEKTEIRSEEIEMTDKFKNISAREKTSVSDILDADRLLSDRLEKKNDSRLSEVKEDREADPFTEKIEQSLKPCNPNFKEGKEWRVNCQRCVPTYELRRRGYDVTAQPKENSDDELAKEPFSVWKNPDVIECDNNAKSEIEEKMSDWGDGARAQITVVWNNTNMGHTFMAEQHNGKTYFFDPQSSNADVSSYFKRVDPGDVKFCRIDNLDFSEKIHKCYREVE